MNVLGVWAVKHPASGYVQGMNDLLAVFLVVLVDEVSEGDHVDVLRLMTCWMTWSHFRTGC